MAVSTIKNQITAIGLSSTSGRYGLKNTVIELVKDISECREICFYCGWDKASAGTCIYRIDQFDIKIGRNYAIQVPKSPLGSYYNFVVQFTDQRHVKIVESNYTDTTDTDGCCIRSIYALV